MTEIEYVDSLGFQFENMRNIDWGAICGYQGACTAPPGHPQGQHDFKSHKFPLLPVERRYTRCIPCGGTGIVPMVPKL